MVENRIREFRERAKLTQTNLARKVPMASQNLSNIERGVLAPWDKVKRRLAKVLGTTVTELFPEEQTK